MKSATNTATTPEAEHSHSRPTVPLKPQTLVLTPVLALVLLAFLALGAGLVRAAGNPEAVPLGADGRIHVPGDAFVEDLLMDASDQVLAGAERFHLVCAACHGNSGLGLTEGRQAFPASHQRCESCHRPFNPPRMPEAGITARNAFNIGDGPTLRGPGRLHTFPTAAALAAYVQATMPRYQPGMLTADEALAVTAFLLALNADLPASATLTHAEAGKVLIGAGDPP